MFLSKGQRPELPDHQTPHLNGRFRLYRGGQPYHIKGVVYTGDRGGRFPLKDVAARGANSIRSSGGRAVLDEAHRLGLSVLVNLWRMEKVHHFDYSVEKAPRAV